MDSLLSLALHSKGQPASLQKSTGKVLAWLEDNLSASLNTSCDCCRSKASCSFHANACLAVRGKILEDRLERLKIRRRTIEQKNEELEERRQAVEAWALKVRNSSGSTLDKLETKRVCRCATQPGQDTEPVRRYQSIEPVPFPVESESVCSVSDVPEVITDDPVASPDDLDNPDSHPVRSRSGLKSIRAAFKKMTSFIKVKPTTRSMTTQTSNSLMVDLVTLTTLNSCSLLDIPAIIEESSEFPVTLQRSSSMSDVTMTLSSDSFHSLSSDLTLTSDLYTYLNRNGLKCTRC